MIQKFGLYFALALILHLILFGAFGINIADEPEVTKQKPLPEIIKASILDDEKIQQEANRLKAQAESKRIAQNKQQKDLENKRKKEQKLLQETKHKRQQEEKKAKKLALKEQQRLKELNKQKVIEAARLAKIKKQKRAAQKRLDELKKAKQKAAELAMKAEQKRQHELLVKKQQEVAKRQREVQEKAAQLKKQQAAEIAQIAQDKKTTISITAAIQQSVNSRWIRPITSNKGLRCMIRVKLLPTGDVMDVQVVKSSGDSIFDRSAANAVRKASPLPVPKNRALFSKHFRVFTFDFNPDKII